MVSDTVLGAAIGVSGAVVGSLLTGVFNWLSTQQRIEAENDRRHADYYLQEKVETLSELHGYLEKCRQNYIYWWEETAQMSEEEYESRILQSFYDYESAMGRASLFLDDSQRDKLTAALEQFKNANGAFSWYASYADPEEGLTKEPPEWVGFEEEDLKEAVEAARDVLREEINEPVKHFESE